MTTETQYKVRADLELDPTGRAKAQAVGIAGALQKLGGQIKGAETMAGGMVRQFMQLGGAYLGLQAVGAATAGLIRGAIQYQNELERTKIALTSVLQAVDGGGWDENAARASGVFEELRQDALESVATTQQLFETYQSIVGPIRQAGFGLGVVRDITKDAVAASSVLGVDLSQASRDISMMVRGTAGMDVKLFSMLRSTGAIAETTEQWNKSLTAQERVTKLQEALGKFAPAAEKFGKSWAGVTSSFQDIRENFTSAAMTPVFGVMTRHLDKVNMTLLKHQDRIKSALEAFGQRVAKRLDHVFTHAEDGVARLAERWDELAGKLQKAMHAVSVAAPIAGKMLAAQAMVGAVRGPLGGAVAGVAGVAGWFGGGAAAGGAGAGASAAGGGAAAAAGGAGVGMAAAIIGGVLAAVGAMALAFAEQWGRVQSIMETFRPMLAGLGQDVMAFGVQFWRFVQPVLKVVGHLLSGLVVPAFQILIAALRLLFKAAVPVMSVIADVAGAIYDRLRPAFDLLWSFFDTLATWLARLTGDQKGITTAPTSEQTRESDQEKFDRWMASQSGAHNYEPWKKTGAGYETPTERQQVVNDFRGSKISVKQDFRDADPDRVLMDMVNDISRQAELRIQTGFVPALSG
jgi:hypothetical protein